MDRQNAKGNPFTKTTTTWLFVGAVVILIAALLMLTPTQAEAPEEPQAPVSAAEEQVVAEGCELLQTLTYTRCEHTVTRRVTAPVELIGKTLAEVEPMYEGWRITEFSPKLIKMEQRPDIHCPDHVVLMSNPAGELCIFENKYGDALAMKEQLSLTLSAFPAAAQEELQRGIGFSTLPELEQWLESAES